jgi:DNA-binding IscR family transcriptional regulator
MLYPDRPDKSFRSIYESVNRCQSARHKEEEDDFESPKVNYLIQRNWFEVRDKLRQRYPTLTAEDVSYETGKKEQMMRAIEQKLEVAPAALQKIITQL